ncbi:MAG: glycosyltransferase family 4 protein [Oscillospiraceae bacterium]|nr:glycosyltransferase family 4 protein [Oscillospiraceae bacterium]
MRKVVFVICSMVANGAERVMSLLVNKAAEQGIEATLVLISSDTVDYPLSDKVNVHFVAKDLPKGRIRAAIARFQRLRKVIRDVNPDVVVSFLTTCNVYSCLAAIGLGVPVIVSERNDPVRDCPKKLRRLMRNISYRLASGFIFQTEEAKAHFNSSIQGKSTVIPNPVKDGLPFAEVENREKTIVAAGRLTKQKNYPMMLEAFALFAQSYPQYSLKIFGEGEDKATLKEYAKALGVADKIAFMGLVSDLHERIKQAGMFVLSSDYEGISNSLLEAMSMGLPCVSTDCPCGGSRHLIQDGVNGLLVPVGDAPALAAAMKKIAESDAFAQSIGKQAQQTRKTHAAETIIEQYFTFIRKTAKTDKR